MNYVFAPGCALLVYKPRLVDRTETFLNAEGASIPRHTACCKRPSKLSPGTCVVNASAGCGLRYGANEGLSSTLLWDFFTKRPDFVFPDYGGVKMAIHDPCPTKQYEGAHQTVRGLLQKMNISVVEPQETRDKSFCCGNSLYDTMPIDRLKEAMKKRADSMPCEEVVVYCVSCIKAMQVGGKKPRYLLDLLFGEETGDDLFVPGEWHKALKEFMDAH